MSKPPGSAASTGKRGETRKAIGQRIFAVRKLYDENRTRYVENYELDGKPVHHTTWRLWEEGVYLANAEVMVDFCNQTGATMDWIYRGILDGVDEDLKLRMFEDNPELLTWYRADRISRRDPPPGPSLPRAPEPAPAPSASPPREIRPPVPGAPERGRRRRGRKLMEGKSVANG